MGAYSMADELRMPRPKNVTTIKPSGTISKIADTTEGCHRPLGRYLFNNVNFSKHDPLLKKLSEAGYHMFPNPTSPDAMIVRFPVEWSDVEFSKAGNLHVNREPALSQLERYKMLMENYVEHNCSITVSYDEAEIPEMVHWLRDNWDSYVGVSFIRRTDPTKSPEELGHKYLPQEVVTKDRFEDYSQTLRPVSLDDSQGTFDIDVEDCVGGVCPVK